MIKHNLNVMVCSIDLKYYEILQFDFCCFFIYDVWPLQLLINNPVFYFRIFSGFSDELECNISISLNSFIREIYTLEIDSQNCLTSNFFRVQV